MSDRHEETVEPRGGTLEARGRVLGQSGVARGERGGIGDRPHDRQIVGRHAAQCGPSGAAPRIIRGFGKGTRQNRGQRAQHREILAVIVGAQVDARIADAERRAQAMQTVARGRDVAFAAQHGLQFPARVVAGKMRELPTDHVRRQMRDGRECPGVRRGRDDHEGRFLLPATHTRHAPAPRRQSIDLQCFAARQHADAWMPGERRAQRRGMDPARPFEKESARFHGDAGESCRFRALHRAQERRRPCLTRKAALAVDLGCIVRELQHAAARPGRPILRQPVSDLPQRELHAGHEQTRQRRVVRRELGVEHALRIAGCLLRDGLVALDQHHVDATGRQACGSGRAGQTGPDHDCLPPQRFREGSLQPRRTIGNRRRRLAHATQHLALGPETRRLLDAEARRLQRAAHVAGTRVRRASGSRAGMGGDHLHQFRGPQLGVPRRCEPVEKPRIDHAVELRQRLARVTDQQRECHAAAIEHEALPPAWLIVPLLEEACRQRLEFGPERQRSTEIRRTQRQQLRAHVVQAGSCRGGFPEGAPGAQEIETGTEAGLADREDAIRRQCGKAFDDAVAFEEYVARFLDAARPREVHVAELRRVRLAVDPVDHSSSSTLLGQLDLSRRDSARSASTLPPVWHRGQ